MLSGLKRLIKPGHITIVSANTEFRFRPALLLIMLLTLLAIAAVAGSRYFPQKQQESQLPGVIAQLQHERKQLNERLAETEAMLALRDGQIEGLEQEMELLRGEKLAMTKRLDMFDDVLAARKVKGVHFLRPSFIWSDETSIRYQMILVKGENYPRWLNGHLEFSVVDTNGQSSLLNNKKNKNQHKVEMTTQTFIEGTLHWPNDWIPQNIKTTMIDHLGKKKGHIEVPILGSGLFQQDSIKEKAE